VQQQIYNNGITSESNNNRGNVAKVELSNSQPVQPPGQTNEKTNETLNGLRKSPTEKNNNNGYQYNVINSSGNLRNNVSGAGTSNGQHNNLTSSQNQTIPLCEQEGQVKIMKLAGLTVLMHRKKGEIIYRLADNMSVSSLSDVQREALLKEIKTLHDSNAIVTQSMSQFTQNQGTSSTSTQSIINAAPANSSQSQSSTSLPDPIIGHDTSTRARPSSFPISTSTSSITATKSVNSTAIPTASKQLYIPLASRPPPLTHSSAVQPSDRFQSTIPSNMTSQTLYSSSSLDDSFYSDGSSRSTRRYTKTGRYAKKRSTDETDSQYTQEYSTQYQHIPTNTTLSHSNAQTPQLIRSVQPPPPTYYTSTTPITRPIVQYYSAPTRGVKRTFQSTGIQRTAEEINHHLDVVQR
jgi:hypothetical protein